MGVLRLSERCVPVCLPGFNSQLPDLWDAIFKHVLSYHCGGVFFTASATRNDFVILIFSSSPPPLDYLNLHPTILSSSPRFLLLSLRGGGIHAPPGGGLNHAAEQTG